jgi:fumarate reductase flavoprotein subunit
MPIAGAPFMAIALMPGITYTMGGIAIDAQAQVLDAAGAPIPGLFAAGTTTGGLEGGRNVAYLGGLLKAGSFGLIAAERVAALARREAGSGGQPAPAQAGGASAGADSSALAAYPALRAVLRYGRIAAPALGLAVALLCGWLLWPALGLLALPVAALGGAVAATLALSYVELVRLITELLLPSGSA